MKYSGGSRPSAKEWARLSMNVEFCEDNSGTTKKMCYFRKNKGGGPYPPGPSPGSATEIKLFSLHREMKEVNHIEKNVYYIRTEQYIVFEIKVF